MATKKTSVILCTGAVLLLFSTPIQAFSFADEPGALMMRWPSFHDFADFDLDSWPAWPVASFDVFRDPLLRWHRTAPFADTWLDRRPRCRDARRTPDKGEARLDRLRKMRERYQEMITAEEHRREVEKKKDAEKQRNDAEEKKTKAVEIRLEGFRPSDIDVRLVGTTQLRVTAHKVSAAGVEVRQRLLMLPEGLRDADLKARFDGHVLTVGKRTEEVQDALEGAKQDPSLSGKDNNASIQNSEDIKIHNVEDSESFRDTQVPIEGSDHLEIPVQNSERSTSGHSQAKAERKDRKSVKRRTEHLDDATIRDED